jgi:hypothetical protein
MGSLLTAWRTIGILNPIDLIDPSVEDPEQFLRFLPDGRVVAKDAYGTGRHRAEETIRILNLKCVRLQNMRANAIRTYTGAKMDIAECPEFIDEELNNIRNEPFATAIKQFLLCL